jgi:carboxyl-terminal processing protease
VAAGGGSPGCLNCVGQPGRLASLTVRTMTSPRFSRNLLVALFTATGLAVGVLLGVLLERPSKNEQVVNDALSRIERTYYRNPGSKNLADAAIAGMVHSLNDQFSNYFTAAQYRQFQQGQQHTFSGIGVDAIKDPLGLRIAGVFPQSPAGLAHLRRGDVIVAVGNRSLKGRPDEFSRGLIRGRNGTPVTITVLSRGKRRTLTLHRAMVVAPIVTSAVKEVDGKKLGYVSLAAFDPGAHADVAEAVRKVMKQGAQGIVFDLRENGGGLVSEARLIASLFLNHGTVVTTRGRDEPTEVIKATGDPIAPKIPLVVLVDRNTASASEIVTGALKDNNRATVVGTNTYGKGVFQEVTRLDNGGALDITVGHYFTPNGTNLGAGGVKPGAGIRPDVRVTQDPKARTDQQLAKALQVLAAKTK